MAFLAFEGIDASGKSTLLNLLGEKLQNDKVAFIKTKEPGGTEIGSTIRNALLAKTAAPVDPLAEALLYCADRKQHIEELIKPSLKKSLWVLSDRYWASTSAYQCGGRGIDEDFIQNLKRKICAGCEPDLWILLDLPVEKALKRLCLSKKNHRDRLEMENSAFHQKVREYYLKLAGEQPSQWLILDAENPPELLLERLLSHLRQSGFLKM